MWVFRQPPPRPRINRSGLLALLSPSEPRALAEVSMGCSAAGVIVGSAAVSVGVTLGQTGVKTASASTSMSMAVSALGVDANSPSASAGMVITASARGVKASQATTSMTASLANDHALVDLLMEPQHADIAASLDVSPVILAQASVSMSAQMQAQGFQQAPTGAAATATTQMVMTVAAEGRIAAAATASMSMSCTARGVSVIPAGVGLDMDAQAQAVFLGPAVRTAHVQVEMSASAEGVRITAGETPKAPTGRTIDWQTIVAGASAKVPDYEFGHKPQRRTFFQR